MRVSQAPASQRHVIVVIAGRIWPARGRCGTADTALAPCHCVQDSTEAARRVRDNGGCRRALRVSGDVKGARCHSSSAHGCGRGGGTAAGMFRRWPASSFRWPAGGDRDALPAMDSLVAYVRRWERSGCGISERYMLLYCAALGIAPREFGSGDSASRQAALSGTAAGHHAVGYAALRATTFITEPAGTDFAVVPAVMGAQDGGQSARTLTDVLKAWDELMHRRAFLRGAGAAGMLALTPYHPAELPPGDRAEAVEACAELTASCRRLEAVLGPGAVYGLVADHQRRLASWLQDARSPAAWRQLAAVTADAGILLAWLSFDLDHFDEAALRYRECSGLARGLDDVNLRAFLAGRMSRTLSECGHHANALDFADAAERIAGTAASGAVRSWLAVTRGYVHACLGAEHERFCRGDLEAAAALLGDTGGEALTPCLAVV